MGDGTYTFRVLVLGRQAYEASTGNRCHPLSPIAFSLFPATFHYVYLGVGSAHVHHPGPWENSTT